MVLLMLCYRFVVVSVVAAILLFCFVVGVVALLLLAVWCVR